MRGLPVWLVGGMDSAGEAAEVSVEVGAPLSRVRAVLQAPRSTVHARRDGLGRVAAGQQQAVPAGSAALTTSSLLAVCYPDRIGHRLLRF
jgi:hypothetical protein